MGRDMSAVQHYSPSKQEKKGKGYRLSALGTGKQLSNLGMLSLG